MTRAGGLPVGSETTEEFERFWRAYPRRVAKGHARKAWAKAIKAAPAETIIEGATRYAAERARDDPKFTKHPATWLNGECWDDEPNLPAIRGTNGHDSCSSRTDPAAGSAQAFRDDPVTSAVGRVVARRLAKFGPDGPGDRAPADLFGASRLRGAD